MRPTYVWPLPLRLFHALLVAVTLLAFITAEEDNLLTYHAAFGVTVGTLFAFRVLWGFMDVRYSRFKDFNFSLRDLRDYMLNIFGAGREYTGHNPAASWVMAAMMAFGLLSAVSGMFAYGVAEGRGVLSFLNNSWFRDMELFEELHEITARLFMGLIFAHMGGVLTDWLLHRKTGTLGSIINGYKNVEDTPVSLNWGQKLFAALWIATAITVLLYALSPGNAVTANGNVKVDYQKEHADFYDECIACHTLYPPFTLPKASWNKIMSDLENHFGDDASLDEESAESIRSYLIANAAESSTKESAFKIMQSMERHDTIAVTQTPFWKDRHDDIEENVFKHAKIKSKANCKACHSDIESGRIENENIKIPE